MLLIIDVSLHLGFYIMQGILNRAEQWCPVKGGGTVDSMILCYVHGTSP